MTHELRSGDEHSLADAVAVPRGIAIDHAAAKALAAPSITFAPRTFHRVDTNTATVIAYLSRRGHAKKKWKVWLTYSAGSWKLVSTQPLGA